MTEPVPSPTDGRPQRQSTASSSREFEGSLDGSDHDPCGTTLQPNSTSSQNLAGEDDGCDIKSADTSKRDYVGLFIKPEMCIGFNSYVRPQRDKNPTLAEPMQDKPLAGKTFPVSFGADGTTATINRYGNLMQISKFLGVGRSGIFSADHFGTDEPYQVKSRIRDLKNLSTQPYGMGFRIADFDEPELDFICDRWPRFTRSEDDYKFTVQYFVNHGIIFQQFIIEDGTDVSNSYGLFQLRGCVTDADIMLRDLEWQDSNYEFNKDTYNAPSYETRLLEKNTSLVRSHSGFLSDDGEQDNKNQQSDNLAIELVMAVFLDGEAQELQNRSGASLYSIKNLFDNVENTVKGKKRVEITVAYRLQIGSTDEDQKNYCIEFQELIDLRNLLSPSKVNKGIFSTDRHFDFTMRRSLEHILSVCCIPVRCQDDQGNTVDRLAITCGDLSGHRIVTSASFFAFRFLISVHDYLFNELRNKTRTSKNPRVSKEDTKSGDPEQFVHPKVLQSLAKRIEDACRGHFNWISSLENPRLGESPSFFSDYWASGQNIRTPPGQKPRFLGANSLIDAALQFIKLDIFRSATDEIQKQKPLSQEETGGLPRENMDGNPTERETKRNAAATTNTRNVVMTQPGLISIQDRSNLEGANSQTDDERRRDEPNHMAQDETKRQLREKEVDEQGNQETKDPRFTNFQTRAERWVQQLKRNESRPERGPFAFPRFTDEVNGNDNYYLDDHFWIWRALKALENIGFGHILNPQRSTSPQNEGKLENQTPSGISSARDYSSTEAQKHILKRFTTENPTSKKRMLAVFRSSSETRFMFRSRDTALFYGMRHSLFSVTESNELLDVWRNTLETQILHQNNETTVWSNPLRYALALIMASEGCQINSKPAGRTFQSSYRTLMGSSGVHGLFPGWMDELTKQPEPLLDAEYRDDYWHSTFEIPYIIWTYQSPGKASNTGGRFAVQKSSNAKSQEIQTAKEVIVTTKTLPFNNFIDQQSIVELQDEWLYNEPAFLDFDPELRFLNCKDTIDFNCKAAINSLKNSMQHLDKDPEKARTELDEHISKLGSSLIALLFSEFLEEYTSVLCSDANFLADFQEAFENHQDLLINWFANLGKLELLAFMLRLARNKASEPWPRILDGTLERLESRQYDHRGTFDEIPSRISGEDLFTRRLGEREHFPEGDYGEKGVIFDILRSSKASRPKDKRKHVKPPVNSHLAMSNKDFMRAVSSRRRKHATNEGGEERPASDEVVKKRLICLSRADYDTAMLCYLASPWSIKDDICRFFERHKYYDKYFFDETTAVLNTWRTEFHISFYQMHDSNPHLKADSIPDPIVAEVSKEKFISKAAVGFHFNGDFFDRYWTCHFIEFNIACGQIHETQPGTNDTKVEDRMQKILESNENLPRSELDKQPWRQRKVLELIFFDQMLREVTIATEHIVKEIRGRIREISGAHDNENTSDAVKNAVSLFQIKGSAYFQFSSESKKLEEILNALEDDLSENLEQVTRWRNRETARAPERPRWTRNDERRYRPTITKLLASNDHRVRQLERCRTNVQTLRGYLASTREYIRDDLNLRGAEDVRLFTYVTATFLPIGFAASIFSMGGFPEPPVLGSMIGLTTVALFLTATAIVQKNRIAHFVRNLKDLGSATDEDGTQDLPTTTPTSKRFEMDLSPFTAGKNAISKARRRLKRSETGQLPT